MRHRGMTWVLGALSLVLLISCPRASRASGEDDPAGNLSSMSLEELLDLKITVASGVGMSTRESPGVVTLITRDEIEKRGALDFVDVLRMVPGLDVENDMSAMLGIGVRGLWASEGKVLILIDGIPMNDMIYESVSFGHHFPVDMIEMVEVIRGPGSAVYGGAAELAVIKITTLAAKKKFEGRAGAAYAATAAVESRRMGSVFAGGRDDDLLWSVYTSMSDGHFSDRKATDWRGWTWDTGKGDVSLRENFFADAAIAYRDLSVRFIADQYLGNTAYNGYSGDYQTRFTTYAMDASYDLKLRDGLKVTPRVSYRAQEPWETRAILYDDGSGPVVYADHVAGESWQPQVSAECVFGKHTVQAGASYDRQDADDKLGTGGFGGRNHVLYERLVLFGQGLFMTPLAIVTIGGRYEHHSSYGDAFAPRLALTRQFEDYHVKLMAGRAFRSPSIANVAYNPGIVPENSAVYEAEVGRKMGQNSIVTVNVFDQAIDHPIVYGFTGSNDYENGRWIGSRGAEAVFQYRAGPIDVNVAYSNSFITRNEGPEYAVPGDDDNLLAFPTHKATASVTVTPMNDLHVTPSAMSVSERWAITEEDADGNPVYDRLVPSTLVNLHVLKRNAFAKGLDISGGVRNLFDEDFGFVQAYYGGEAPIPDASREFYVRMTCSF